MILYLTSSAFTCADPVTHKGCKLNPQNGFVDSLRKNWKKDRPMAGLIITADPAAYEMNDGMCKDFLNSFRKEDLAMSGMMVLDGRNADQAGRLIRQSDLIILGGGHVPTQKDFFESLNLKKRIKDFEGIVIGISAGSMNCAKTVYALPELEGEAINPEYQRFFPGLGMTDVMIIPHMNQMRYELLDGLQVIEDIAFGDSCGRAFCLMPDGSYICEHNGKTRLFGEAYIICDERMEQICSEGSSIDC